MSEDEEAASSDHHCSEAKSEKDFYSDVYRYLTNADSESKFRGGLSKDEKKTIRRRAKDFVNRDGFLFLITRDKKGGRALRQRQWVADKDEQQRILESCHDDSLGK